MYRPLALAMGLGLILPGCSPGNNDATPLAGGLITDVPPIHLEQTLVTLAGGKPQREQEYLKALADCRRGSQPVTALGDEDVARIGRTFKRLWFEGARATSRSDGWDFSGGPPTCRFKLVHQSSDLLVDTGAIYYTIDLLRHSGQQEPSDGGRTPVQNDDDKLDPALARGGMQRLGYTTDAGQRCLRWRDSSDVESCAWGDGHTWGFLREEDADQATSYDPDRITLWVKPADGDGAALSTQMMSVGKPFDPAVFVPPRDVAIVKAD